MTGRAYIYQPGCDPGTNKKESAETHEEITTKSNKKKFKIPKTWKVIDIIWQPKAVAA